MRLRGRLHPPGTAAPAIPAAGAAFGADGWRCYLPELGLELWPQPPDAAPPALPLLTEPEAARALLERSIRSGSPRYRDLRLRACTPSVVRHRLGRHCTVVYRLTYPAGLAAGRGWPDLVVAKAYHGDEGRTAYAAMRALWHSPLRTGGVVSIAEPLAYVPELRVLVQGPVRGDRTLKQLIPAALRAGTPGALAALAGHVRRAAAGLAALHRSGAAPGPTRTWADELAEVREVLADLAVSLPQLAAAAAPLLARLEALAAAHPADPPVPAHGSFRPAQVLLHGGQIGFIDFDGFCQAEPAMDLAQFRATAKEAGLNGVLSDKDEDEDGAAAGAALPAEDGALPDRAACLARLGRVDALCEAFLAAYEARHPVSRPRVALWEALALLTMVLHRWTKVKPARLPLSLLLLERHLQGM